MLLFFAGTFVSLSAMFFALSLLTLVAVAFAAAFRAHLQALKSPFSLFVEAPLLLPRLPFPQSIMSCPTSHCRDF